MDQEVKRILDSAYTQAKKLLQDHRDQLDLLAGDLLVYETMDAATFKRLIDRPARP